MQCGKQTTLLENPVYIRCCASVAGKKESEGPLGEYFDVAVEDPMFGMNNWEEAESRLQEMAIDKLLIKADVKAADIRFIFAGDLLGQLIATTYGLKKYDIPLFGLYGACSTMGEAISLASLTVDSKAADMVVALASSHFASAEKQFRFPLEYGNQRPESSTWTATGCGAVLLNGKNGVMRIKGFTTGKIVDYGVKDAMNMGACMAPAAADLIEMNLKDMNVAPDYYDMIITGDLGHVGQRILFDLLKERGIKISDRHMDCGIEVFAGSEEDTKAGGSGCGCSAITLCTLVEERIRTKKWNRVLFVPTGALQSTVSYNEGKSIPGIAHGIMIEGGNVQCCCL